MRDDSCNTSHPNRLLVGLQTLHRESILLLVLPDTSLMAGHSCLWGHASLHRCFFQCELMGPCLNVLCNSCMVKERFQVITLHSKDTKIDNVYHAVCEGSSALEWMPLLYEYILHCVQHSGHGSLSRYHTPAHGRSMSGKCRRQNHFYTVHPC